MGRGVDGRHHFSGTRPVTFPGPRGNAALGAAGRPEVTGLWAECCGHCGHQVGCDGSPGGALAAQPCRAPRASPVLCTWAPLQFPCDGRLTLPVSCSREGLGPPFWARTVEEMAPNSSATSFLTRQTAATWMPLSRPQPGADP